MTKADVVIIGGGVVGASVAYHLVHAGCKDVLIVERDTQQGAGSTGKATGGVRVQFETEINIKMSLYSIEFFNHFKNATGYDCSYEPRGYLFLAANENQFAYLKANVEKQQSLGIKQVSIFSKDEIACMVTGLRLDDIVGGSFCSIDGFIDPLAVMRGFTNKAIEGGAKIMLETEATGIETQRGRVIAIQTSKGRIETRNVVIASGAWASNIAKMVRMELPVAPLRRQIAWTKTVEPLQPNLPMVIDLSNGFHFRPAKDSNTEILLAWPDSAETFGFKTDYDNAFTQKVLALAAKRAPFLSNLEVVHEKCRAGLYEMTPDHHPIIGPAPNIEGLFFCNGFSGHGVMHSPASGRMIAEIVLRGESKFIDASPLRLQRFKEGRLLQETAFI